MAQHDDAAGDGDGLAGAPDPVAEPAAGHGEQVHQREVHRVDGGGGARAQTETARRDEVQREQSPHAVVGETLPHLGHEECGQSAGVAEEGLLGPGGARGDRVLRQAGRHGRSLLSGRVARDGYAPGGGLAGTGGSSRPPHAWGVPPRITERRTATTGIHAPAVRRRAAKARPQVIPSGTGRVCRPAHKRDPRRQLPPKVPAVQQALVHHTAGHCRIWKDLRRESQVLMEPRSPIRRSAQHRTSHPQVRLRGRGGENRVRHR
ncbi:hypothetical protein RKD39_004138 [Streptomyces albogriseolus]